MVDTILSEGRACIKDDYQTAHETLCARLQQAHTIADVVATHDLTDGQMYRLIWTLADILKVACSECENLNARDFEPVK
ncbi:MAG: hypothetical protein K0R24_2253 [Gammaproteobacteria bacterium]|nr:hypothetical protein [Gammaproteobacteria bacterium]